MSTICLRDSKEFHQNFYSRIKKTKQLESLPGGVNLQRFYKKILHSKFLICKMLEAQMDSMKSGFHDNQVKYNSNRALLFLLFIMLKIMEFLKETLKSVE